MKLAAFATALALSWMNFVSAEPVCDPMAGIQVFDKEPSTGLSEYRTISCATGLDAPKVLPINDTTIDWWYFDAVGNDGISSLVVVFFLRGADSGFPGPSYDGVPWIQVTGTYPNGTSFLLNFIGDEAIVSSSGQGANGIWGGENHNVSFTGTPDLSEYQVEFHTEAISGMFNIKSVSARRELIMAALKDEGVN